VDSLPDDIDALKAALLAGREARRALQAQTAAAEAMIAHLKLQIALYKRDRYGTSAERGRKILDQLEMQLEDLETDVAEAEARAMPSQPEGSTVRSFTRARPVRGPLPTHLPRERVVLPSPTACPCCGGRLAKLGDTITGTLDCIPRSYKVIQTVREKFSCRACEAITQPPAPFPPIARGRAGANLLAEIVHGEFAEHQPLNRQSEGFAREGIDLSVSTLADWVGACTAALSPLVTLIRLHVMAGERIHGDDTTVPVLASPKTVIGHLWTYVRDDWPFGGTAAPAAIFAYSRDRGRTHPCRHLAGYAGILQADAYAGFGDLYDPARQPARSPKQRAGRTGGASCSCSPTSPRRRSTHRPAPPAGAGDDPSRPPASGVAGGDRLDQQPPVRNPRRRRRLGHARPPTTATDRSTPARRGWSTCWRMSAPDR